MLKPRKVLILTPFPSPFSLSPEEPSTVRTRLRRSRRRFGRAAEPSDASEPLGIWSSRHQGTGVGVAVLHITFAPELSTSIAFPAE